MMCFILTNMKLYKKEDYKTSIKIEMPSEMKKYINNDYIYLVPASKKHKYIHPDYKNTYKSDMKNAIFFIEYGSLSYNSLIQIYNDGTWSQYRDGCFIEYVGKIAI